MNKFSKNTHNKNGCFFEAFKNLIEPKIVRIEVFMRFKTKRKIIKIRYLLIQAIQLIVGTAIVAISTSLFLLPNQLSSGGFSGIATITYYLLKIPMRNYGIIIEHSIIHNSIIEKWKAFLY